jgi:hypothetical protein
MSNSVRVLVAMPESMKAWLDAQPQSNSELIREAVRCHFKLGHANPAETMEPQPQPDAHFSVHNRLFRVETRMEYVDKRDHKAISQLIKDVEMMVNYFEFDRTMGVPNEATWNRFKGGRP